MKLNLKEQLIYKLVTKHREATKSFFLEIQKLRLKIPTYECKISMWKWRKVWCPDSYQKISYINDFFHLHSILQFEKISHIFGSASTNSNFYLLKVEKYELKSHNLLLIQPSFWDNQVESFSANYIINLEIVVFN